MSNFKSWRPEVIADSSGEWVPNGLRFATEAEALANAKDLESRWFMVRKIRAMQSEDEPNYRWDSVVGLVPLEPYEPLLEECQHNWVHNEAYDTFECSICKEEKP